MSTQGWLVSIMIVSGFIVWTSCIAIMHRAVIVKKQADFNLDNGLLNTSTMVSAVAFWSFLALAVTEKLFALSSWPYSLDLIVGLIINVVVFIGFGLLPPAYYSVEQDKLRYPKE